ncbi:MAG: hypothetical protein WKF84_07005 [Pyrinomonadaceae bacterium]
MTLRVKLCRAMVISLLLSGLSLELFSACASARVYPNSRLKADDAVRPPDQTKFALIITGASGEEIFSKQFSGWAEKLRQTLVGQLSFPADQVSLLSEKSEQSTMRATAAEVRRELTELQRSAKTESSVFIFFIGHGTYDGQQAKFNLVGPDLAVRDYKELIEAIPARQIVIVNMASASGEFVKPLAANGRVLITATRSGQEQNATKFPEHFINALGSSAADADKNNRISVLEAFNYATKLTTEGYQSAGRLATEHALLEDNGDGVGHQTAEGGDGLVARQTYFDSAAQSQIASDHESVRIIAQQKSLEGAIQAVKARKSQLPPDAYYAELEKLFVELAKLSRELKSKNRVSN